MAAEGIPWDFINQIITQCVFMGAVVFGAAKWVDKRNQDKVDALRYELIGDKDHIGLLTRLETNFNNNLTNVQKQFDQSLKYAEREQDRLNSEIERLRNLDIDERVSRRGRSITYDNRGEKI